MGATAPDAAHDIKTRMRADLKAAMAARQSAAVATLRTLIAAIDNSEAPAAPQTAQTHDFLSGSAEVARLELSREDIDRILHVEIAERAAEDAAWASRPAPPRLIAKTVIYRRATDGELAMLEGFIGPV